MKKTLFIGDINVDIIMGGLESFPIPDKEITCKSFDVTLGSSAVLCACAYSSLGGKGAFLGLAGNDDYGDYLVKGISDFGLDTSLIKRTGEVKTGVTLNLIKDSSRTQVTYPGAIIEFSKEHINTEDLKKFGHIHFAGPYLQLKFISAITGLLEFAKKVGITTSLDPQWDAAEKWEYMDEWLPLLTYFFANTDEALSITGAANIESACHSLKEKTAFPVVKDGGNGVFIFDNGKINHVPSRKIDVVDTTGAGDSFNAGFMYAKLIKNMGNFDAARFANAVAARSCTFVGGVNARSTYNDVLKFMEEKNERI